ncbi:MAG TPA: type III-A CRISPR-associated RAMP protein Csm4 [Bacteroidales bacterium]|nr:type III-A CRISPR-associated RAMP protein Csm4 [Bacteroidales bacterium]
MDFHVIHFWFKEPVHISNSRGDYGKGESIIRSDTLFAAVMQMWALLGKQEWIAEFVDKPESSFALTSLFPFVKKDGSNYIYFFPKIIKDKCSNDLPQELVKKFKKLNYYDLDFFSERLHHPLEIFNDENMHGVFLSKKLQESDFPLYTKHVVPRIMRPRNDLEDSRPFYVEKTIYRENAGLFCMVHYASEKWEKRLMAAFRLLQDEGLGTDRSVGMGRFVLEEGSMSIPFPLNSSHAVSLSVFCPENLQQLNGMIDDKTRYHFVKRGGWISEPYQSYRKRSVYMFTEGSLFHIGSSEFKVLGKIADLTPHETPKKLMHPIYRTGLGFFIPCTTD